jgi:Ca2+-binding EF-hand superfamily protein
MSFCIPDSISFVEIRVMSAEGPQHQVSIDEIFDSFQEIDVDASGKVSKRELERYLAGGDIQHTFVVVFKTADIGCDWHDRTRFPSI